MLGRDRGIGDNGGHGRVWAWVDRRLWGGVQEDCRREVWQGLVGSPLHQVSKDVRSQAD